MFGIARVLTIIRQMVCHCQHCYRQLGRRWWNIHRNGKQPTASLSEFIYLQTIIAWQRNYQLVWLSIWNQSNFSDLYMTIQDGINNCIKVWMISIDISIEIIWLLVGGTLGITIEIASFLSSPVMTNYHSWEKQLQLLLRQKIQW